ncbi:hypothetical protein B0J11DRAFT_505961 [Dendryphion nanum]|uniref:Uncharacterized protein n=1 Tax=Dendryphion nanum TaxID=256645 RepID=A0A9P9IN17_9PLEO|nr:hypothetical protein B0J11DRAFT_505961 [Dendryphion nanum]
MGIPENCLLLVDAIYFPEMQHFARSNELININATFEFYTGYTNFSTGNAGAIRTAATPRASIAKHRNRESDPACRNCRFVCVVFLPLCFDIAGVHGLQSTKQWLQAISSGRNHPARSSDCVRQCPIPFNIGQHECVVLHIQICQLQRLRNICLPERDAAFSIRLEFGLSLVFLPSSCHALPATIPMNYRLSIPRMSLLHLLSCMISNFHYRDNG